MQIFIAENDQGSGPLVVLPLTGFTHHAFSFPPNAISAYI
jgi:hypothetical protein